MVFHPPIPVVPEVIDAKTVGRRVNDFEQAIPKHHKLSGINKTFKYRVLDTLPVIQAGLGRSAKPAPAFRSGSRHVIGDQDLHGVSLFP